MTLQTALIAALAWVLAGSMIFAQPMDRTPDSATRLAVSKDGTRIAFDVNGSGPAVVLLHGGGQTRRAWHDAGYVTHLAKEFTVITLDLRGNGDSDKPTTPAAYYVDRMKEDILAVADAAKAPRFVLWGFSYGANVGRYLAASSDRVDAMVYIGIPFGPAVDPVFRQRILERTERPMWLTALLDYPAVEPSDMKPPTLWVVGTANVSAMNSVMAYDGKLAGSRVTIALLDGLTHSQELDNINVALPLEIQFTRNFAR